MPDRLKIAINLRVTATEAREIDDYRSGYSPMLTRAAATRQLIREALAARKPITQK